MGATLITPNITTATPGADGCGEVAWVRKEAAMGFELARPASSRDLVDWVARRKPRPIGAQHRVDPSIDDHAVSTARVHLRRSEPVECG
mgnify:CR=1 FL=1